MFLPSVGRRAKLEMDTANHVGIPLMPPTLPPSLLSIQSTDINTDLYSFTRYGLHHRPGREKGQEEREKTESGSDCLGPQAFVTFTPERGQKKGTKIVVKRRARAGRESAAHKPLVTGDNRCQWHPRASRGGVVWWGVHYVKITLMPFRHWAPLLSNPTRAQPGPIQKPKE